MSTVLIDEESKKRNDMMEQSQKVTILDAQVRFVREVDELHRACDLVR